MSNDCCSSNVFNEPRPTDTAIFECYALSLHDALPIYFVDAGLDDHLGDVGHGEEDGAGVERGDARGDGLADLDRSEEHTSELQSHVNLVCRLLLEKKILVFPS